MSETEAEVLHAATKHHLNKVEQKVDLLMADIGKLKETLTELGASVDAAVADIAALKSTGTEVTELKAKIAELEAGTGPSVPSQPEVDELTTQVEADKSKLDATKA